MAQKRAVKTRAGTGSGQVQPVDTIDAFIEYVEGLIEVICNANVRWAVTCTKITKGACPPPGGSMDLCLMLRALLKFLKELRAKYA